MKIISIDELSSICGYFNENTTINNGYGCEHPEQEECDDACVDEDGYTRYICSDEDKLLPQKNQGKCYHISCPLASRCDLEDVKSYDHEEYERIMKYFDGDSYKADIEVDNSELVVIEEDVYNELMKKQETK